MLTKVQKNEILNNLAEKFSQVKSAVFADYTGLNVAKMTDLRKKLREKKAEMKVAKKTIVDLALKKAGVENAGESKMPGQLAIIFGYEDEVSPSKIVYDFSRKEKNLKIIGGILSNKIITSEGIIGLAKLPTRQELLAQVVGSIANPLTGIVNVLQGNIRGLVQVLSQIKK